MENEEVQTNAKKSCWKRKSNLEKLLICTAATCFVTVIVLIILLALAYTKRTCETGACIKASADLLAKIDQSADPCDDFYKFCCGSFVKATVIPENEAFVTDMANIKQNLDWKLAALISTPISKSDSQSFIKTKNLYNACMNTERIRKLGAQPLKEILKELGGWPIIEGADWKEDDFDWQDIVIRAQAMGFSSSVIVDLEVERDVYNSSHYMITVNHCKLTRTLNMKMRAIPYISKIAQTLGAGAAAIAAESEAIFQIQEDLRNISTNNESIDVGTPMTTAHLQKDYPYISWHKFVNGWLLGKSTITEKDEISILDTPYLAKLGGVLAKYSKREIANCILWDIIMQALPYTSIQLSSTKPGPSENSNSGMQDGPGSRKKVCISTVLDSMPLVVSAMYTKSTFNKDAKPMVTEMVENIRNEFMEMLRQVNWFDEKTRQKALQKAEMMGAIIAYPDELVDSQKLDEVLKEVEVDVDYYLKSVLSCFRWHVNFEKSLLKTEEPKDKWVLHSYTAVVNAFYAPTENTLHVPIGILHGSFFGVGRPQALNYGGIGFVAGHEFTHGFDNQGRLFDKYGSIKNWWEPKTDMEFRKRAQCMVNQYSNYTDPQSGAKLDGNLTLSENIADNGGLTSSYMAYQKWLSNHGPDHKLPGLDFTPQQLFWLAAGSVWCGVQTTSFLLEQIKSDPHSPSMFRILGVAQNSDLFAKDFNCPPNSKMNPQAKCKIW